jgi:hypothetical protein
MREIQARHLITLLEQSASMKKTQILAFFGWSSPVFHKVLREANRLLSRDQVTIVSEPAGQRQPWDYYLTVDVAAVEKYQRRQKRAALAACYRSVHALQVVANANDGRTTIGKVARMGVLDTNHIIAKLELELAN